MKVIVITAWIALAIGLTGCASAPSGAEAFSKDAVPSPGNDEVVLIVFRQVTPPTISTLTVDLNGISKAELPNNSYVLMKTKAGSTVMTVSYPVLAAIKPVKFSSSFAGGGTYYLEIVGGLGDIRMPGPYVEVWGGMVERPADYAIGKLTQCCRRVGTAPP